MGGGRGTEVSTLAEVTPQLLFFPECLARM